MTKKNVLIVSVSVVLIVIIGLIVFHGKTGPLSLELPCHSAAFELTINNVLWDMDRRNPRCVYEIPNDGDRIDAVRYIERNEFSPGQELIDAGKADDSVLKVKLKGGFVLFTTLRERSRLFKAATQPLNIRIEGNSLRWGDLTMPITDDLRIILVGKNPYGDGYCVVFAAGSNRSLVGINSIPSRGDCSYHIYRDGKLLKEGNYNKNFKDRISKAEAVEDVQQLFSTMQRVHPDLLARVKVEDYIKLKQQTLDGIAEKLDKDGNIGIADLAYLLYYAAAFFQDGHTSVHWRFQPNELNTSGKKFPPFVLCYDNGRFVVTASSNKSMEGLEVLAVNGKTVREFLSPILDRISGETLAFKADCFTDRQAFWYTFSNLCGSAEYLIFKTQDSKGRESEQKVETVGFADFKKLNSNVRATKLQELRRKGTQVHFLDSDRIAYVIYPAFTQSEEEEKKIDGIFKEIKARRSQDLIMDIRGNGGGTSRIGDFIFSYLYGGKFRQYSKIRVKLSHDVMSDDEIASMNGLPQSADLEGIIMTMQMEEQSVSKPDAFFSGRVFLLVDNGSFSGASSFAAMFRDYGAGTILGYETGGLPTSFGENYELEMRNSGILCTVSLKQFFGPKPRPGDDEHGVIPDIPMTSELLRPYQNEDDPVLAFTLDHIKRTRRIP